jgi:hypothetical protein
LSLDAANARRHIPARYHRLLAWKQSDMNQAKVDAVNAARHDIQLAQQRQLERPDPPVVQDSNKQTGGKINKEASNGTNFHWN